MEIWIIGLLFVALMVYVSTRIKRNAAQAYEREEIDSKEFGIIKPEGLMHPFREKSEYAFEAYSKDYGEGAARSIWRTHALMRVLPNTNFQTAREDIKSSADKVLSDKVEKNPPPERKIRFLETIKTVENQKRHEFWKIIENTKTQKTYELKVSVLEKYLDQYAEKAQEMIESFTVK